MRPLFLIALFGGALLLDCLMIRGSTRMMPRSSSSSGNDDPVPPQNDNQHRASFKNSTISMKKPEELPYLPTTRTSSGNVGDGLVPPRVDNQGASFKNTTISVTLDELPSLPMTSSPSTRNGGDGLVPPRVDNQGASFKNTTISMTLDELPYLPMIKSHCQVEFVGPSDGFCDSMLEADVAVMQRILEHHFECSAKHLATTSAAGKCIHMNANARYLIPFVFPGFYYLPTTQANVSQVLCTTNDVFTIQNSSDNMTVQLITPSFRSDWRTFYDQLRYCDYVMSNDEDLMQAASSVGVPLVFDLSEPLPSRPIHFRYRKSRLNYTTGNEIASRLPLHLFQATRIEDEVVEAPTTSTRRTHNNKTLVIMLGNLRGGEKTWSTTHRHLLDLNNADLALVIGKLPDNKKNISSLLDRAKYTWEFDEYEDWGDAIDEMMNSTEWRRTVLPQVSWTHGLFGGVKGYRSSTAISFMARYWLSQKLIEEGLVERYDRFVLTRSDHFYKCPHDLSLLDSRYIWVPSGEDYGGITDRHLVCHRSHILAAIDMYPHFLSHPEKYHREDRIMKDNAEQMIRLRWIEKGLYPHHVRRFPRVMYTAATNEDKSRWSKTYSFQKYNEDGLRTKYPSEFNFARCYCGGDSVRILKTKRRVKLVEAAWEYACSNTTTH